MIKKFLSILLVITSILVLPKIVFSQQEPFLDFTTPHVAEAVEGLIEIRDVEIFQEKLDELIISILPSLAPPIISNINVSEITENSAVISWRTNIRSSSIVAFSSVRDFEPNRRNPYLIEVGDPGARTREHRVRLINLTPGTIYHFQVRSTSLPGLMVQSKDQTFSTLASKIRLEITRITNTEIEVRWTTPIETSSFVEYRNLITGEILRVGTPDRVRTHLVNLTNLVPNTSYELRAFGYDVNNILFESNLITTKTKLDDRPPEITSIRISNALMPGRVGRALTLVSWRTNEPANSIVYFEKGVGFARVLANRIGREGEFVLEHTVILTTETGTVYRIQVVSVDEAGNETRSSIRTILTPRGEESILDIIIKNFQEAFGVFRR